MKKTPLILFSVFFLVLGMTTARAQAGLYSKDSISHLKGAFYEFLGDEFTYCTDAYNDVYGQFCLSGSYTVAGDSIYFTVRSIETAELGPLRRIAPSQRETELVVTDDTSSSRREKPSSSNYWAMTTGKIQRVNMDNAKFSAAFRLVKVSESEEYIEIDGDRFHLNDFGMKD